MKYGQCKLLLSLCVYLAYIGAANAEFYKWVDKEGKVHFGDAPPDEQEADKMKIKQSATSPTNGVPSALVKENTKQVRTEKPITYIEGKLLRSVKLDKIVVSLNESAGGDVSIGKNYTNCDMEYSPSNKAVRGSVYGPDTTLLVPDEGILKDKGFSKQFTKVFQDNKYKVILPSTDLFNVGQESEPDLLIGAVVKEMAINMCRDWKGQSTSNTVLVASYLKVDWQVYDPLNRKLVYETTTEGSDLNTFNIQNTTEISQTDARSFGNAASNLLSKPAFVKVLYATNTNTIPTSPVPVSLKPIYGNGIGDFVTKSEKIKTGTVTIRTAHGHGSGLVLSSDGYLLTNSHVIAGATNILVLTAGKQYRAVLVKENTQRDIALLKIEGKSGWTPLVISKKPVMTGETIYVVGTPLDEELSHTVTRGILSASRIISDKTFYQTDAAVNPGNSGGPAFNKSGEVIGVTVAGMFAKDGGSLNINFIIPIEDALASLGL